MTKRISIIQTFGRGMFARRHTSKLVKDMEQNYRKTIQILLGDEHMMKCVIKIQRFYRIW